MAAAKFIGAGLAAIGITVIGIVSVPTISSMVSSTSEGQLIMSTITGFLLGVIFVIAILVIRAWHKGIVHLKADTTPRGVVAVWLDGSQMAFRSHLACSKHTGVSTNTIRALMDTNTTAKGWLFLSA